MSEHRLKARDVWKEITHEMFLAKAAGLTPPQQKAHTDRRALQILEDAFDEVAQEVND
jgi:hypothetical protein